MHGLVGVLDRRRPERGQRSLLGAVGNTQLVVSLAPFSLTPAVFVVGTVLSNDAGPGGLSAGPASIASVNGGSIALAANGSFVYTPAAGFPGPTDTFVYTLTDGNGITDTATVTVNLSGVVWYVNNSGANGDGRSHSPFNALNNAQAPSNAGDVVFVHAGAGTTPGAITLKASQTLWGNAHTFTINGLCDPGAGTPVLGGTVTSGQQRPRARAEHQRRCREKRSSEQASPALKRSKASTSPAAPPATT